MMRTRASSCSSTRRSWTWADRPRHGRVVAEDEVAVEAEFRDHVDGMPRVGLEVVEHAHGDGVLVPLAQPEGQPVLGAPLRIRELADVHDVLAERVANPRGVVRRLGDDEHGHGVAEARVQGPGHGRLALEARGALAVRRRQ